MVLLTALCAGVAGAGVALLRILETRFAATPYVSASAEPLQVAGAVKGIVSEDRYSSREVSSVLPASGERWVFFVHEGAATERAWGADHYRFDFIKGGDEPFHVLGTQLETDSRGHARVLVATYEEHGAVIAAIVLKDNPPPAGSGVWAPICVQTLADDGPLPDRARRTATITGRFLDLTLHLALTGPDPRNPSEGAVGFTFKGNQRGGQWALDKTNSHQSIR